MSRITVEVLGVVKPGSVLILHDELEDRSQSAYMVAELKRIAGHDQFVVLFDPNHDLEMGQVDVSLIDQIKEVLHVPTPQDEA